MNKDEIYARVLDATKIHDKEYQIFVLVRVSLSLAILDVY